MELTNKQLKEILKDLLQLPVAKEQLDYLNKGIGTKTCNAVWLRAAEAVKAV